MNYGLPWRSRLCVFCVLQIEAAVAGQACFDHNQEHLFSRYWRQKQKFQCLTPSLKRQSLWFSLHQIPPNRGMDSIQAGKLILNSEVPNSIWKPPSSYFFCPWVYVKSCWQLKDAALEAWTSYFLLFSKTNPFSICCMHVLSPAQEMPPFSLLWLLHHTYFSACVNIDWVVS